MRRAILALGCILLSQLVDAQVVEIVPTWTGIADTDPRSALTLVVQIRNTLPDSHRIGVEIDLPPGWRRLIPDTPVVVAPGASSPRIVSLFVPQEAEAGDFRLRATAVETTTDAILGYLDIDVRVHPHLELQIDGLDGSTHVLAGELIELPFRVANRSNTELIVTLTLETRSFYSAEFDGLPEGQLTIASNQSTRVVARVRTPSVISRVEDFQVEVVATGRPSNGGFGTQGRVRASFRASVEIIPVVSEEPAPFHTIPALIEATTTHDFGVGWNGDLRVNFSGGGYLDDAGRHRLDFRIAPSVDLDEPSFTPENDTYRVNYSSEQVDVFVGDNGHAISPLLGTYRYGRGILARYKPGQFQFAGLYYFPQAVGPPESTVAAMSGFRILDSSTPSGYRYRTALNSVSLIGSNLLVGNHHELFFGETAELEVDLAGGWTAATPLVWGASAGGGVSLRGVRLSGLGLYAGPNFPGSNGDQVALTASAATTIEPLGLSLGTSSSFRQENLSRTAPVAAQSIRATANGSLALSRLGGHLAAGWRLSSRRDLMPTPAFHHIDNSLTAMTRFPIGNLQIGLDAKLSLDRDALIDAWTAGQRYSFSVRLAGTSQATYNANLSVFGQRSTVLPTDRRVTAGLSTNQDWGPVATVARAGLGVSTRDQTFAGFSSFLAAEAEVAVLGDHTILLDGYLKYDRTTAGSGFTGGVTLGYAAPVRVPTSRQSGVGSVEGFAFDAGTGEPAEGVVIRAGDRAVVTGPEGVFGLSSLHAGEYYLMVDTSRYGRGRIPDLPLPIKIPIEAGEATSIALPIVRSGSISGSVSLFAAPEAQQSLLSTLLGDPEQEYEMEDLILVGGLANTVVHATRDDEIRRILTDRNGNFLLSDLRPGRWVVRLSNPQFPRYHKLVVAEFEVMAEAGQDLSISFQVQPIRRPVTIIQTELEPLVLQTSEAKDGGTESEVETVKETVEEPPVPDTTPPVLDSGAKDLVLAMQRYSVPDLNAPRLLQLPWGASPEETAALLAGRIDELVPGEMTRVGGDPEGMPLRTYRTSGIVQLGLLGDVELTFLDPKGDQDELFLVGVTVQIPGERNGLSPDRLEPAFGDLTTLFAGRWKVGEMESSVDGTQEIMRARTGGIDISYVYDGVDQTVTLDYRDSWYAGVAIDQ